MLVVKTKSSTFDLINQSYNEGFSYKTLKEQVEKLKTSYSQSDLLDYFLKKSEFPTTESTFVKYTYPILLLDYDVIAINVDRIVKSLDKKQMAFMCENFHGDILIHFLKSYIHSVWQEYRSKIPVPQIYDMISVFVNAKYKTQNKEFYLYQITSIQEILSEMLVEELKSSDPSSYIIEKITRNIIFDSSEATQSIYQFMLSNIDNLPMHILNTVNLQIPLFSKETIITYLSYLNNLTEIKNQDRYILGKFRFTNDHKYLETYHPYIHWGNLFYLAVKAKDEDLYWTLLEVAMKYKVKNYQYYTKEYCLLFFINRLSLSSNSHNFNTGRFIQCMKVSDNKHLKVMFDKILKSSMSSILSNNNKTPLQKSCVQLIDNNASSYEEKVEVLSSIMEKTNDKGIIYTLLTYNIPNLEKQDANRIIARKLEDLRVHYNQNLEDTIVYLISDLDVIEYEEVFNKILSLESQMIKDKCNQIMTQSFIGLLRNE